MKKFIIVSSLLFISFATTFQLSAMHTKQEEKCQKCNAPLSECKQLILIELGWKYIDNTITIADIQSFLEKTKISPLEVHLNATNSKTDKIIKNISVEGFFNAVKKDLENDSKRSNELIKINRLITLFNRK